MNAEVQDELLMLLRSQQRELTDLRGQIEAMQSSIMSQVEHVLSNHQEQERILQIHRKLAVVVCILNLNLFKVKKKPDYLLAENAGQNNLNKSTRIKYNKNFVFAIDRP